MRKSNNFAASIFLRNTFLNVVKNPFYEQNFYKIKRQKIA